jgi:hypothetical protein
MTANDRVIDTKKAERRVLKFTSLSQVAAEVDKIVAADKAGTLKRTGQWSTGQNFAHLAAFMEYPYEGYPASIANPPWLVRFIVGRMKKKFLYSPMRAGARIPGIKGGTLGAEEMPTAAAGERLKRAIARIDSVAPTKPNPLFGPMTHDEWRAMHLRHSELHLGFLWH